MSNTSEIILSNQPFSGDSTLTITGEKFKGDGYYGRSDGVHTVQYTVSNFVGSILVQVTLATSPIEEDWVTLADTEHTSLNVNDANSTGSFIKNFTGNYVWVRAVVRDFTAGSVSSILLKH